MKKTLAFVLLIIFAISSLSVVANEGTIAISINGVAVEFPDAQPFVDENNRTQVPIGALAEILGIRTNWNESTQTAQLVRMKDEINGDYVRITIGRNEIEKGIFNELSGVGYYPKCTIEMDTAAILKENRTFVPIRYIAESFHFIVDWNGETNTINLTSKAENSFDLYLLEKMPKDKNYMISPFSLKMALAMTANGADGETKREILDVLDIADLADFNRAAKDLIDNSNKNKFVAFHIANSIWHNSDFNNDDVLDFSEDFKRGTAEYFRGTASKINNKNGAKTVNDWISKETNGKINDVLTNDMVQNNLSFLVNTIYFKGDWANPFPTSSTEDDVFTDLNGNKHTIAFMNHTGNYNYYENANFQMLAKPYEDNNIKMYFVLPKTDEAITQNAFENAVANMKNKNISFSLPKFKTEYLHDNLIDILKDMGIQTAFNPDKADFLMMYSKPISDVFIGLILQKTFIEVDEKSTGAAAATVVATTWGSAAPIVVHFKCDRPFYYFIRNDSTGDILFMGEYAFVE